MLIKFKNGVVINILNVNFFDKIGETFMRFDFDSNNLDLEFSSQESRDIAFEKILDSYRWQRMQCTLD
jgi:hypothetical protein